MARDDKPGGPDGEVRMTPLERRARRLLRLYPAAYRRERAEEIIGTLLEASDNRNWPRLRDVRALAVGGLKARAAQNRQLTTSANLRVAVMAGIAMYLSAWIAAYLSAIVGQFTPNLGSPFPSGWPAAVMTLFSAATIILAWTAARASAVTAVVAVSAAIWNHVQAHVGLIGLPAAQVLCWTALVGLAIRSGRPAKRWLFLPGVIALAVPLIHLGVGYGWIGFSFWLQGTGIVILIIAAAAMVWVSIDARLMVAVLTYVMLFGLQTTVTEIPAGLGIIATLPLLLVVAAIAAPTVWLLRRQSASTASLTAAMCAAPRRRFTS